MVPPLLGFFSKQFVLYSAVQSGYYFMSIIAIVVSVISASYYLKIIKVLLTETESSDIINKSNEFYYNMYRILNLKPNAELLEPASDSVRSMSPLGTQVFPLTNEPNSTSVVSFASVDLNPKQDLPYNVIGYIHSFLISTLTLSILFFILKPSIILNSISILSLSLYNC